MNPHRPYCDGVSHRVIITMKSRPVKTLPILEEKTISPVLLGFTDELKLSTAAHRREHY